MQVERNPRGAEAQYLQSLNSCFPGWGDERMFEWAFRRQVSGPPTDLMLLREGGELMAGSAVSYRTLVREDGTRALAGIMTGSWTLAASRGRGAFTQIIEESLALTSERGGALLLAFVTETNASFRRLVAAGSTLFPTRYVSSRAGLAAPLGARPMRETTLSAEACFERFQALRPRGAHFHYGTAAEWAGQLVHRPGAPTLLEVEGGGLALVETHGDFDRLQALGAPDDEARFEMIRAALARAHGRGKRLFLFESQPERATRLERELGLDAAKGYLTALPAGDTRGLSIWSLDSGDRM